MIKHNTRRRFTVVVGGMLLLVGVAAAAENPIRYIATTGKDANGCGPKAPCRTFQRGVDATPVNGILQVVDSGRFGRATIGKSMTVAGNGATVIGDVRINAADAVVAIRDLKLSGDGRRSMGVYVRAASAVHVERCTIERFVEHGFASADEDTELFVTDSVVRDNGGPGIAVFILNAPAGAVGDMTLTVDSARVENNGQDGLLLIGVGSISISRTVISGNRADGMDVSFSKASIASTAASQNGFAGFSFYGSTASLESSSATANGQTGIVALGNTIAMSNSTVTNNGEAGILADDGVLHTRGNNTVSGNPIDVDGTLVPLAGM